MDAQFDLDRDFEIIELEPRSAASPDGQIVIMRGGSGGGSGGSGAHLVSGSGGSGGSGAHLVSGSGGSGGHRVFGSGGSGT